MKQSLAGVGQPGNHTRVPAPPPHADDVRRLLEQRASLLSANVYTPDDPVIRALDAEIQSYMPVGK